MKLFHITICLLFLACFAANLASCKALAMSGIKKYGVEMTNAVQNIDDQIKQDGVVSDAAIAKLGSVIDKWSGQFGKNNSSAKALELKALCEQAKTAASPFNVYKEAQMKIMEVVDALKLEDPTA